MLGGFFCPQSAARKEIYGEQTWSTAKSVSWKEGLHHAGTGGKSVALDAAEKRGE
jgi:hypothetical protein